MINTFRTAIFLTCIFAPNARSCHRFSLGVYLAEAEASTRQLMDVLGHDDIDHAELYSREASQVRLAVQGMDRVVRLVTRKPMLGEHRGEPPYKALINNDNGGPGGTRTPTKNRRQGSLGSLIRARQISAAHVCSFEIRSPSQTSALLAYLVVLRIPRLHVGFIQCVEPGAMALLLPRPGACASRRS